MKHLIGYDKLYNVLVDVRAFNKLRDFMDEPPEVCGAMKVRYLQAGYYLILDFVEQEYDKGEGHCVPKNNLGWFGIWHTHPHDYPKASSIDRDAMLSYLKTASVGDTLGIPPLSLVAAKSSRGDYEYNVYLTSYKVLADIEKINNVELDVGFTDVSSLNPTLKELLKHGNNPTEVILEEYDDDMIHWMFNFLAMRVQEVKDQYIIKELQPLTIDTVKDSDGIFIGASVPPHLVPLVLKFFSEGAKKNRFYTYFEGFNQNDVLHGLYEVTIEGFEPLIIEGNTKVLDVGFGMENRIKRLREDHGIDLISLRKRRVVLFGAGFLGSRILTRLSKLFNEIAIVDYDTVGEENIGYQELYGIEDLGMPKVLALSRKLLQQTPLSRIYMINAKIPEYPLCPSGLVESLIKWSDLVITTFDRFPPRLSVLLACNKFSKPLIDVGVGPQIANVRVWYSREKACIACYNRGITTILGSSRAIYAADPRIADVAVDVASMYVEGILRGNPVPTRTVVKVENGIIKIETQNLPRDENCSFCSREVETSLSRYKPWEAVARQVRLKRGEDEVILSGIECASFLKYLENLGYRVAKEYIA